MKNPSIKVLIFTIFIILGLSACSQWNGDLAKIVISFGKAGRAADYNTDAQTLQKLEHQIELSNKKETIKFKSKGTATFESFVAPGEYTVWVYSWLNNDVFAAGTIEANLQAGQDNILTIPMYQAHLVRFNSNGGSSVQDQVVFNNKKAVAPSPPTRTGYSFAGWYMEEEPTSFDFNSLLSESITLYAKWNVGIEYWWTWNSSLENSNYNSLSQVSKEALSDNSGCTVTVNGYPNDDKNWASQVGCNYTATVGKTYKVSWTWKANDKNFENVSIRYAQEDKQDGIGDNYYQFGTNEEKLTIPYLFEETQTYKFTMPGNCKTDFTFLVGEDTGSFVIRNFKIEEVLIPSGTKKITFSHSRGNNGIEDYDNWVGFYDIPSSERGGNKITKGDVYTFTYSFTSDVWIINDYEGILLIFLVDNSNGKWIELTNVITINSIQADTLERGKITFTAKDTTSSSSVDANRLAFVIYPAYAVERHPTFTFTQFEFIKGSGGSTATLKSSAPFYQIVDLPYEENRIDVMKVNPTDSDDYWAVAMYSLSAYKGKEITINLSVDVKREGAEEYLIWQVNNDDYSPVAVVSNAEDGTWYHMSGELIITPSNNYPYLYLNAWNNKSEITTYYIDNFTVSIKPSS